jgi:hypothetical protein
MISLRLAIPAVLTAAAVAGCFTYFVQQPIAGVVGDSRLPPAKLTLIGPDTTASTSAYKHPGADEKAAIAYLEAAQAILRRAPGAQASASNDELPITGRIPLPRKRPIPRQ